MYCFLYAITDFLTKEDLNCLTHTELLWILYKDNAADMNNMYTWRKIFEVEEKSIDDNVYRGTGKEEILYHCNYYNHHYPHCGGNCTREGTYP